MEKFEHRVAITGIGKSQVGRRLMRDPLGLTLDACLAAMDDAGLTRNEIDGLSTFPGAMSPPNGISGGGIIDVENVLRVHPKWFNSGLELPGQLGSVVAGAMAVASGLCRHVLCFRCVWEASHQALQRSGKLPGAGRRVSGDMQWLLPYGAASAANWIAQYARRHFHEYGTTREQLAQIPLNGRRNAALNPDAVYQEPLTLDDYMSSRMISDPFCLFDCDVPCDGAVAFVLSDVEAARDCRQQPVKFESIGCQIGETISWDQCELTHEVGLEGPSRMLWERTDLKPSDVDVAQLYDGFSFNALSWLERLGFCPKGEGGRFIEDGARIARDGELPLNTDGGQLSAGRLHGYGFLHEACTQLRGDAGPRQVPGNPEVAIATSGGGMPGSAMLLTKG